MRLRTSYTVIAPLYDAVVARATRAARQRSVANLKVPAHGRCLWPGIGTGLDLPLLPREPRHVGLDLNHAMLRRCRRRAMGSEIDLALVEGDVMALPFPPNASMPW